MRGDDNYQPYTYLIGWSKQNLWYYGVEFKKTAKPSNLWNSYFTSSNYVKKYHKQFGDPDVIQIRKIFETAEDALKWETKVLRRLKVIDSDKWINISLGDGVSFKRGLPRGYKNTKLSEFFQKNGPNKAFLGRKHTEETKEKIRLKIKGTKRPDVSRSNKKNNPAKSSGAKISLSQKERYKSGVKPWNFGLTKETDTRLAIIGNNISKSKKGEKNARQ